MGDIRWAIFAIVVINNMGDLLVFCFYHTAVRRCWRLLIFAITSIMLQPSASQISSLKNAPTSENMLAHAIYTTVIAKEITPPLIPSSSIRHEFLDHSTAWRHRRCSVSTVCSLYSSRTTNLVYVLLSRSLKVESPSSNLLKTIDNSYCDIPHCWTEPLLWLTSQEFASIDFLRAYIPWDDVCRALVSRWVSRYWAIYLLVCVQ